MVTPSKAADLSWALKDGKNDVYPPTLDISFPPPSSNNAVSSPKPLTNVYKVSEVRGDFFNPFTHDEISERHSDFFPTDDEEFSMSFVRERDEFSSSISSDEQTQQKRKQFTETERDNEKPPELLQDLPETQALSSSSNLVSSKIKKFNPVLHSEKAKKKSRKRKANDGKKTDKRMRIKTKESSQATNKSSIELQTRLRNVYSNALAFIGTGNGADAIKELDAALIDENQLKKVIKENDKIDSNKRDNFLNQLNLRRSSYYMVAYSLLGDSEQQKLQLNHFEEALKKKQKLAQPTQEFLQKATKFKKETKLAGQYSFLSQCIASTVGVLYGNLFKTSKTS